MEIDRLETLRGILEGHSPQRHRGGRSALGGLRLQDLDLHEVEDELLARTDLTDLVVLGGRLSPALMMHLVRHGAIVFPSDPQAPVNVYRARTYTADELYAGLAREEGYAGTPDGRAYAWTLDRRSGRDAYATMLRAIHDESITDALDDELDGLPVVGVMGGHAAHRGSTVYAAAARLGFALAEAGFVVATGGGPGAMEGANLGAYAASERDLSRAVAHLARTPSYQVSIRDWARAGLTERGRLGLREPGAPLRSVGIPTWFYGHEPPNVFGQAIAKYFSNALREDGLLARSSHGVVVMPGSAGTVQEVFQAASRLYYGRCMPVRDRPSGHLPPLVLIGRAHWTSTLPVWPALQALAHDHAKAGMREAVHLVDSVDHAVDIVADRAGGQPAYARRL
ncbi:MAG: Rossmann fold nucleotide-binding protein [Dermatophilaceae bacterium]